MTALSQHQQSCLVIQASSWMCRLDVARLEGLGMSFMCSHLVEVRKAAVDVLFGVRQLHGKLVASGGRSNPVTPAPPASNSSTPGRHAYTRALSLPCCSSSSERAMIVPTVRVLGPAFQVTMPKSNSSRALKHARLARRLN